MSTTMARVLLASALLIVLTFASCDPIILTEENFLSTTGSGKAVFVKFYAPWCGHCKQLAPTWDKLSDQFADTNTLIAKVDCTVDTKLCADNEVKGYPTLKLFQGTSTWDHRGARDIQSLIDFVTTNVGQAKSNLEAKQLTDDDFEDYVTKTPGIHFIKFYAPWCGHCQRLAPIWNDLSVHFQTDANVHISKIDCTKETKTCSLHEVKGYPTLIVFINGLRVEQYSGSRHLDSLVQFVTDIHDRESPVVRGVEVLSGIEFSESLQSKAHIFVKFYAPWCGHCKSLAPTWEKLAEAVHSSFTDVTIAKVDCTIEGDLCSEQSVHGYPTLVLFSDGDRKEYRGARDFDSLLRFIQENN